MAHTDHLEHLRSLRLFRGCTTKELEHIDRLTDEVNVEAGNRIVEQGSAAHEAFVIVAGTAKVVIGLEAITELGAGQHFGELALLDGGPRTASVDAVTDMTLLVIHRPAFMGLLDELPGLSRRIMATMATIIRDLERPPA